MVISCTFPLPLLALKMVDFPLLDLLDAEVYGHGYGNCTEDGSDDGANLGGCV